MIRVLLFATLHFQTVQAWSPAQTRIGEQLTRSNFIYSTASAFFFSEVVVNGNPDECEAKENNPRYIEKEVQMKYGDDKNGNPRTRGVLVKKFTGDNTGFLFPTPSPVRLVKEWPEEIPFTSKDFFRADEGDDENFYTLPRLVYHIDEPAVASLTQYYRNNIPKGKRDRQISLFVSGNILPRILAFKLRVEDPRHMLKLGLALSLGIQG